MNESPPILVKCEDTSRTRHVMTFNRPVTEDEVWAEARNQKYFGYHPAGYGGWLQKVKSPDFIEGSVWVYCHSNSCD